MGSHDPGQVQLRSDREPLRSDVFLKAWITGARHAHGRRLSLESLAKAVNVTCLLASRWESLQHSKLPSMEDVEQIARVCGVPIPRIAFPIAARRGSTAGRPRPDPALLAPPCTNLADEIRSTGMILASRLSPRHAARNAAIFSSSFIDRRSYAEIGAAHGMSASGTHNAIQRMLAQARHCDLPHAWLDALVSAHHDAPGSERVQRALGPRLTLESALEYGATVLGRAQP